MECLPIILLCSVLVSVLAVSFAGDTITPTESITDGQTLVSVHGNFELGFFSPGNSTNRYLGIWYKKISNGTVVWVANRESPLTDSAGELKLSGDGVIRLLNRTKAVVWSSQPPRGAKNPVLQILDSGNLVVRDANDDRSGRYLWQSFDYPCDTFLPGMRLGRNFRTGLNWSITSWKSPDDPSRGEFSYEFDPRGYPQLVLRKGSILQFRNGPWNGLRFSGNTGLKSNPIYKFVFVYNEEEVYYTYDLLDSSVISRVVMNQSGLVQRFTWIDRIRGWNLFLYVPVDHCDNYALCGAYGSCNIYNSPVCQCLKGFVPKSPQDWNLVDWSGGCVRRTPLGCNGDGFLKYSGVKWPDTSHSLVNKSMNLNECKSVCLKNCSCTAYMNADISGEGSGCLLWFGDLVDIREFDSGGQDIYIRMAASELALYEGSKKNKSSEKKRVTIIVTSTLMVLAVLLAGLAWYIWRKNANEEGNMEDLELPIFNLTTLVNATDNFSPNNKLGEGGFGPVFQGRLVTGEEIAVKRLSSNSGQGLDEFKNEVKLIANLQHRNLVKLLGCCIQGGERMLIYEYMPNKSLDFFIFDQTRSELLDWQKRNDIISGIARGILYLHQDSRLRIIHRDLKASNILLDAEMNPKISDFGMARIFRGNQTEANTSRVVGTYGYMSPEYAVDGIFSTKSDVFSFGVLVLEIISGKKNRGFYHQDHQHNLLGHAWRLWNEGKPLELTDASVAVSSNLSDVLRCIHVGLLCVQQSPEDRPRMPDVVLMLGSENATLPQPKHPGFFTERNILELDSSSSKQQTHSTNEITLTLLDAR